MWQPDLWPLTAPTSREFTKGVLSPRCIVYPRERKTQPHIDTDLDRCNALRANPGRWRSFERGGGRRKTRKRSTDGGGGRGGIGVEMEVEVDEEEEMEVEVEEEV